MCDILKHNLLKALRGFQHAYLTPVTRDDDEDDGDFATPKTSLDDGW
ncbi:MAG TPA: hypothetical protein VF583_07660 [Bradyrhizobium sp.]